MMARRFTESELMAADDAEKNNLCPFCGGKPTECVLSPNECRDCWLPVILWKPFRDLQAKAERCGCANEGLGICMGWEEPSDE